jgi:hypothetical protein
LATTIIHLTPAKAWAAWQVILTHLYHRGYPREQVAEWTGLDPNHALIRPYPADTYLLGYGRAHTHCKTPPWMPGAGSRHIVDALAALSDLPKPFEHVSRHVKLVLYNSQTTNRHDFREGESDGYE